MTMNDTNEPSYYEIALTNRQVLMAFVVILGAVLGSFLCGVWVAKRGTDPLHAQELLAENAAQAGEGDELESFKFFTDPPPPKAADRAEPELDKPDLNRLLDKPDKSTTLAEDVGSEAAREPRQQEQRRPNAEPPKPRTQPSPPPPSPPPPSPPPPSPPPSAVGSTEGFIVQVFSTHEEPKARTVLRQLEAEGFTAFIAPLEKADGKYYRVRIGPFEEKAGAERAARGVRKKFKLDTWVTAASN